MDDAVTPPPWPRRTWILSTPRSGSTLLADLLNAATGRNSSAFLKCPSRDVFGEHFHPRAFATWEELLAFDPIVTKLHMHWLEERGGDIPSDTTLIRLHRRDRVGQTWSLISTGKIGFHHVRNEEQRRGFLAAEANVTTTRKEFFDHYSAIDRWERLIGLVATGRPVCDVWYEDLIADRDGTLAKVMNFIGLSEDQWHVPTNGEIETIAIHEG